MFTYTPKGGKALGPILLGLFPLVSLILVAVGLAVPGIGKHILFALALFLTAAGTTLTVRLQLPEYTYEISDADCPGQYDITVTSRIGKRIRPECRVAVAGTLQKCGRKQKRSCPQYLCCRLFAGGERYVFSPAEANGEYALILCPDAEMRRIMEALGVTIQ